MTTLSEQQHQMTSLSSMDQFSLRFIKQCCIKLANAAHAAQHSYSDLRKLHQMNVPNNVTNLYEYFKPE